MQLPPPLVTALFAALSAPAQAQLTWFTSEPEFLAGAGPTIAEGFDDLPWVRNQTAPQGTASLGVSWDAREFLFCSGSAFRSGDAALTCLDSISNPLGDALTATFVTPAAAVGGWFHTFSAILPIRVEALDASGAVISAFEAARPTGESWFFIGVIDSGQGIARLRMASTSESDPEDFSLDDFRYAPIPTPGSIALLALCCLSPRRPRRTSALAGRSRAEV